MLKDFGLTDVRYIASGLACGTSTSGIKHGKKGKDFLVV